MTALLIIDWFSFTERIQPGFQGGVTRFCIGISLIQKAWNKENEQLRYRPWKVAVQFCQVELNTQLPLSTWDKRPDVLFLY